MSDANIKKVFVPKASIDKIASDGNYYVRYRIVSEDGARTSHWSPTYGLTPKTPLELSKTSDIKYSITSDGVLTTLSWVNPATLFVKSFDVFAKWSVDGGTWTEYAYATTTSSTTVHIEIPAGKHYVKMWVQAATFPQVVTVHNKLFESTSMSTAVTPAPAASTIDGGPIV